MAKKIFVVSSREAIPHANSFIRACKDDEHIEYYPWWKHFQPGHTTIEELERFKRKLDGALVILTPDIQATIRNERKSIPNLNVLFEYGFFLSKFNRKHVAVVKFGDVFVPSDLAGVIPISGSSEYTSRPKRVATRTKQEFFRWVEGFKERKKRGTSDNPKGASTPEKTTAAPASGRESRFKLHADNFDAVDLEIIEPIDTSTRLRYRLESIASNQTYVFYYHFRTSENEQGWIGTTNRACELYETSTERTGPESKEMRPRMDIDVQGVIQRRWPQLKGKPVIIDRLRLRGDMDNRPGRIQATVWIYPKR